MTASELRSKYLQRRAEGWKIMSYPDGRYVWINAAELGDCGWTVCFDSDEEALRWVCEKYPEIEQLLVLQRLTA